MTPHRACATATQFRCRQSRSVIPLSALLATAMGKAKMTAVATNDPSWRTRSSTNPFSFYHGPSPFTGVTAMGCEARLFGSRRCRLTSIALAALGFCLASFSVALAAEMRGVERRYGKVHDQGQVRRHFHGRQGDAGTGRWHGGGRSHGKVEPSRSHGGHESGGGSHERGGE